MAHTRIIFILSMIICCLRVQSTHISQKTAGTIADTHNRLVITTETVSEYTNSVSYLETCFLIFGSLTPSTIAASCSIVPTATPLLIATTLPLTLKAFAYTKYTWLSSVSRSSISDIPSMYTSHDTDGTIRIYPTHNDRRTIPRIARNFVRASSDICCICRNTLHEDVSNERSVLPCNHQFHTPCIREWTSHNRSCPMCRTTPAYMLTSRLSGTQDTGISLKDDHANTIGL